MNARTVEQDHREKLAANLVCALKDRLAWIQYGVYGVVMGLAAV